MKRDFHTLLKKVKNEKAKNKKVKKKQKQGLKFYNYNQNCDLEKTT